MNTGIARLRTHQANISRYENMLKTKLTETERRFVEERLSQEHSAIAGLQFMGLAPSVPKSFDPRQQRE
jgi:hypothetical protein